MNKLCLLFFMSWPLLVSGQETTAPTTGQTDDVVEKSSSAQKNAAENPRATGEANINLRTTVTGNQEQPRVMYILPWQSPLSPELDMEMLGSEADAVFGHLERDELQRHLEAAGELDAEQ